MSWNYRLCKSTYKGADYEEVSFTIREVYYNKDGTIWAVTENGTSPFGENVEEVKDVLAKMSSAFEKEIIDIDTLIFAKHHEND